MHGNVVSLQAHRDRHLAREHAEALVLFECASLLARRGDPELMALVEKAFGADFLKKRVEEALQPAPRRVSR